MQKSGQHFLVDRAILKKIAAALDMQKNEVVVEIGAGHGELTEELRSKNHEARIIAIEKDRRLVERLEKKFSADRRIEIIRGDILKLLPSVIHDSSFMLHASKFKLVGNIPYYITGKLLRMLSELERKPSRCVFMLQKEVAERLAARPKRMNPVRSKPPRAAAAVPLAAGERTSNGMNRLAASVQFWAKPEIIAHVSRENFEPAPNVDSAVVVLTRIRGDCGRTDADAYYRAVRILFQQPRKTILNNLANGTKTEKETLAKKLSNIGVDPTGRPQNLSIGDIAEVARIVGK